MMPSVASPQVDISRATPIGGYMSEAELMWLATQAHKCKYIVEFGSFHGRSSRAIADNLMPEGKLWCVDPWGPDYLNEDGSKNGINPYVMPYFCHNLKDHIDAGRVIPVRDFSYNFSPPHKVDMVFIDGDHRYKTVVRDLRKAYGMLNHGGMICGHDYGHPDWHGVKQAVLEYVVNFGVTETIWHAIKF